MISPVAPCTFASFGNSISGVITSPSDTTFSVLRTGSSSR
jgi:hypothetical protein